MRERSGETNGPKFLQLEDEYEPRKSRRQCDVGLNEASNSNAIAASENV